MAPTNTLVKAARAFTSATTRTDTNVSLFSASGQQGEVAVALIKGLIGWRGGLAIGSQASPKFGALVAITTGRAARRATARQLTKAAKKVGRHE